MKKQDVFVVGFKNFGNRKFVLSKIYIRARSVGCCKSRLLSKHFIEIIVGFIPRLTFLRYGLNTNTIYCI